MQVQDRHWVPVVDTLGVVSIAHDDTCFSICLANESCFEIGFISGRGAEAGNW